MHIKAIQIKEQLLGQEDYEVALSVGHLASLYNYDMNQYENAEKLYLRSIAIGKCDYRKLKLKFLEKKLGCYVLATKCWLETKQRIFVRQILLVKITRELRTQPVDILPLNFFLLAPSRKEAFWRRLQWT